MAAIKSLHSRYFIEKIEKHRQSLIASLVGGVADYAIYRQLIGRIEGLDDALKISEEADFEISGDEPGASN